MNKMFDLYLSFLQTSQSEHVQKHAFAALRAFVNKVGTTIQRLVTKKATMPA